jgi:cytochrome c oxidase subunit 1
MIEGSNTGNEKSFLEYEGKHKGILGWILSVDHKRIGLLYLGSMMTFFVIAMSLAFLMRLEMLSRGETIMGPQTYNEVFTYHGVIMIFLFIIPGLPVAFGNFFLPLQIGARDVAFPRLNRLSWHLYVTGGLLAVSSVFMPGGPMDAGWTFYIPYSIRSGTNVSVAIFSVFILGFSSIITGINFVTTIHRMRAPGMTFFRMPLFVWSIYSTAWIQILATPIIGITIVLVIIERAFRIGIFDPALGGDPVLFQHLFWVYSHPAVYIMILPAMGVVSEIITTFSRKNIFGYKAIAYSGLAIAFIGYLVWGHHMFTSGVSDFSRLAFSLLTFLVAIPSGIKIFNWVATLYKGSIWVTTPFLYVMLFISLFSIGGLTGLILGALAANAHLHGTYFVVGHFHYVMFGGTVMIFFGALHYWFPKMFGKMYNEKVAKIAVLLIFVGFNTLYFTMYLLGYYGLPRRTWDFLPEYQNMQIVATIGSWILISGIVTMLINLLIALKKGPKASMNPWGGKTLEWTVSSPPPLENFETIPVVTGEPYNYSENKGEEF